jgi:hypothetical protein
MFTTAAIHITAMFAGTLTQQLAIVLYPLALQDSHNTSQQILCGIRFFDPRLRQCKIERVEESAVSEFFCQGQKRIRDGRAKGTQERA